MRPTPIILAYLLVGLAWGQEPSSSEPPRVQRLLRELCSTSRLAGTSGSIRAAEMVRRELSEAGFEVEWDERLVLLSLPRKTEFAIFENGDQTQPSVLRLRRFDGDAVPPGDIPPFHAYSQSARVSGQVLDCGYGLVEDFARLKTAGVDLTGTIALCRYGRSFRGVKASEAQAAGCVGVLMFSDPSDVGSERGEVWPDGPWQPGWAVQRGSIAPMVSFGGDPSTPGYPSGTPEKPGPRLDQEQLTQILPRIVSLPIGADDAQVILEHLKEGGPGPARVTLEVDAPRTLRRIVNVLGHIKGTQPGFVLLGNHRDAWVRGAQDAGGGTTSLLEASLQLGAKVKDGLILRNGISVAFWDAEEAGLIGSTEWAEANATNLQANLAAYINADGLVSGTNFSASGSPGLEGILADALAQVPAPHGKKDETLGDLWLRRSRGQVRFGLPGSGSDYSVFLHHLGLPILDLSFSGNSGGQYHTVFDDVSIVEQYLDPGYVGHQLAARTLHAIMLEFSRAGRLCLDQTRAAEDLAWHARMASDWLGEQNAEHLAQTLLGLAQANDSRWQAWAKRMDFEPDLSPGPFGTWPNMRRALSGEGNTLRGDADRQGELPRMYRALLLDNGLPGRTWYRNFFWAPDPSNGYGSETWPTLRAAAADPDPKALAQELKRLEENIAGLSQQWAERN